MAIFACIVLVAILIGQSATQVSPPPTTITTTQAGAGQNITTQTENPKYAEIVQKESEAWNATIPLLQPYISTPLTPAIQTRLLSELLFQNNPEYFEETIRLHFESFAQLVNTTTADNTTTVMQYQITLEDFKKQFRKDLGFFAYYGLKLFGGLSRKINAEFELMDTDDSGTVSWQEYKAGIERQLRVPIPLPADYMVVCDSYNTSINNCFGAGSMSAQFEKDVKASVAICKTGLSWLGDRFSTELKVFKAASNSTTCKVKIMTIITGRAERQLEKRSVEAVAAVPAAAVVGTGAAAGISTASTSASPAIMGALTSNPFALLGAATVVSVVAIVVYGSLASASSASQFENYWLKQQNFERWLYGNPLPPCNTPIIYWSPNCGALNTKRATSCPRGQPYMLGACKGWWKNGGRNCHFVGCQSLCVDIVTESCPSDVKLWTLEYQNGTTVLK